MMKSRAWVREPYTIAVKSIGAAKMSMVSNAGPNRSCSSAIATNDQAAASGSRRRIRQGTVSSMGHTTWGRGPLRSPKNGFHPWTVPTRDRVRNGRGNNTSKTSMNHVASRGMPGNAARQAAGSGRDRRGSRRLPAPHMAFTSWHRMVPAHRRIRNATTIPLQGRRPYRP